MAGSMSGLSEQGVPGWASCLQEQQIRTAHLGHEIEGATSEVGDDGVGGGVCTSAGIISGLGTTEV